MTVSTVIGAFLVGIAVGAGSVCYAILRKFEKHPAPPDELLIDAWCIANQQGDPVHAMRETALAEAKRWWNALTLAEKASEDLE